MFRYFVTLLLFSGIFTIELLATEKLDVGSDNLSCVENVSSIKGFKPVAREYRIYFIGDSITRHGFTKATIEKLKWNHISGMAASKESKDYAHLLGAMIARQLPNRKVRLFFGKGINSAAALSRIGDAIIYQPHLVVVQLGEHAKPAGAHIKTRKNYNALLDALLKLKPQPLILCTGVWSPQIGHQAYSGWAADVEKIQRELCQSKNIPFASVEKYALDRSCSGTGGSHGVRWHPNDKGMAGYARELFNFFKVKPFAVNLLKSTEISYKYGAKYFIHKPAVKASVKFKNGKSLIIIPEYKKVASTFVQLYFTVQLDELKTYKFEFKAESNKDGIIYINYLLSKKPYTSYAKTQVNIQSGTHEYKCEFIPKNVNGLYNSPRSLRLFLGKMTDSKIVISDVFLEEIVE